MPSLVVTPKNQSDYIFLASLLRKLGIPSRIFSEEEMEDLGLSILMKEVDRSKKVSRDVIIKKLKS